MVVISTNNKRIVKINEYKALFIKKNSNNSTKIIEYKERLIKYEENYEKFDLY